MSKFLSRKFIMMMLTGIVAPFLASKGVPETVVTWLIGAVMTYIAGQSAVDTMSVKAGKKSE